MTERLTAIEGCMFSGKTGELIRLVERLEIAKIKVQMFKPAIDNRYEPNHICTHYGRKHDAILVQGAIQILDLLQPDTKVVAIDEAQFFNQEIIDVVDSLLARDIQVIIAGLNLDFRGEPFGPMPTLIAKADEVIKLDAVCTHEANGQNCPKSATRTQRLINGKPANYNDPIILIGAKESYAARCPDHHLVPGKPPLKF